MSKFNLKQLWLDFSERVAKDPSKIEPNPKRDWTILFIIFTFMVLGSGAIHFALYKHFVSESNKEVSVTPDTIKTISIDDVEKIISGYQVRSAYYDSLYQKRPELADPSR